MEVKLVIKKGNKQQRVLQLRNEETLVGRRQDCDLRIQSSQISRRHCVIKIEGQAVVVEDLDSVNGTFVNGRRVQGKQTLQPGDTLTLGPVTFRVDYQGTATPRSATAQPVQAAEEEAVDVLPLADDDLETAQFEGLDELAPANNPSDSVLEALEVAEELDKGTGWKLPEGDELRDLLSEMDIEDPQAKAPPKSKPDGPGDSYRVK